MPRLALKVAARVQGRLKLARLLSMGEEDFALELKELEAEPAFERLAGSGALSSSPLSRAAFAARRFAGLSLCCPGTGVGELLDAESDAAKLIRRVGASAFEECFLSESRLSDAERARRCGITPEESARLREFMDRLFIRTEFERPQSAPAKVFSAVAGLAVDGGRPCLRFFNRDVWKTRYRVDPQRLALYLRTLAPAQRLGVERVVSKLQFLDRRKTTLYKALEILLQAQAEYLTTGNPDRRQPLTQRELSAALGVEPSGLNRLLSNKSVELPWGTEAPMKALLPSAKALALGRLEELARRRPELSDVQLARELARTRQIRLSRRSVAQYRKDLGLAGKGRR